jgi:integrase
MAQVAKRGHGEGSIYRDKDGSWRAALTLGPEQGGGRNYFRGATRQEVQRKLAVAKRAQDEGLPQLEGRQTVEQYLTSWLFEIKPTIDYGTWRRHEEFTRLHIVPFMGPMRMAQVTPQQVQALYANRLAAGLSSTTVHHIHRTLHKAFKDAERLRIVARNVTKLVNVPRMAETEIHPLSAEEARQLLAITRGERLFALYALALSSGMRESELLGLQWSEVDFDRNLVRVRWQLQREDGHWVWKPPKTRRSRRQISLAVAAMQVLRSHRDARDKERATLGPLWEEHELVFCTRHGRPLSARNVLRRYKELLKKGDLPDIRFHDLRHTAATLLLAGKVNPKVVSEMLGHASVAITLDIYSHVLPDMQQDAAVTLERILYQ